MLAQGSDSSAWPPTGECNVCVLVFETIYSQEQRRKQLLDDCIPPGRIPLHVTARHLSSFWWKFHGYLQILHHP